MSTVELKSDIHKIIDGIQSEQLLQTLYDFLKSREADKSRGTWNSLTDKQKQEVLLAYDESEDDKNLISRGEMFRSRM
jgi:hypothetical protein